ncbi:Ionotropic receptor 126 [Diabrotica virgifera virgifera]|nr:Ionotropic receptor 126 [Diabrotica virgifera virgifera]
MLILFMLIGGIIFTEAQISIKNNTNIFETCVNKLLDYIHPDKKLVYAVNTNIRIKKYSVVFLRSNDISKLSTNFPTVYLLSGNASEILNDLHKLKILDNFYYFILIVQKVDQDIINTLEQYFITKALFVILNSKRDNYEIYKMVSASHQLIDTCPKQKKDPTKIKDKINKVFVKKYDSLNVLYNTDAPFVISSTEGIHIELLNIVAEKINIKLNFIKSKNRTTAIEVSPEFLSNRTYDFYGALLATKPRIETHSLDRTVDITVDKLVFITPNILITKNWTIFYGEFAKLVWAYFFLLLLSIAVVISLIDYLIPGKQQTNILLFLLSLLFEGTVNIYPKKKSIKIIFINYLIFVLIFTSIYKSQMFDILRKNKDYNSIKRRVDILKHNFKVCLPNKAIFDTYKQSKDPFEYNLGCNSDLIISSDYWKCVNMTAYEKNTVSPLLLKFFEYVVPHSYVDEGGVSLINVLIQDFHSTPSFSFAFRKGHPLLKIFNRKLTILKEAGFVEYQYKIYKQQFKIAVAVAQKKHNFYFKALKLDTLQSVFFVYIVLIGISILTFCLEMIWIGNYNKQ